MERSPTRDFIVGVFVLAGIAAIAYLSISVGGFSWHGRVGLKLYASFEETGSLTVRAPVVIAGVRVGEVTNISLDDKLRARVEMNLDPDLKLPNGTYANITTAGVLGDRYIELQPGGGGDGMLKPGDTITNTADAVSLEKLIGQLIPGANTGANPGPMGFMLSASFDETGSLATHAPVVIAGVRVGEVSNIALGTDFRARVEMSLAPDLKLPVDTFANIVTSGVLGGRYIELQPGGEDEMLKSGDTISHVGNAVILEKVIGQLIYGLTKESKPAETQPAKTPSPLD